MSKLNGTESLIQGCFQMACSVFAVFQNQMEAQYGEHYAQKVEDRLLHYLHELETALPGDTYIDKVCVLCLCLL